ncbi:MAG: tRNA 2-thiouridine(34) synthase MnmA [Bacilli bacterium]
MNYWFFYDKIYLQRGYFMRVVVGMSGGVDSSVAAYLLLKEGYDVVGLFMKNWDSNINSDKEGIVDGICPQEQDYIDAKRVCDKLNIPLYRTDFIKEYWDDVFSYFLNELKLGRTPNPDIMCNKYIKFDAFIKEAKKLGADKVATGHYARIVGNKLLRGIDLNKDQTYFLSQVNIEVLKDVLFPVGNYYKKDIKSIAQEIGLDIYNKKESMGICFIGERHYQSFVSNYLKPNPGNIVNIENMEVISTHEGLMNYTIGQRRNTGVSGYKKRHYVVGKHTEDNTLYIAFDESEKYLSSNSVLLDTINFISSTRPTFATARFRYRSKDIPVSIEYLENNEIKLKYDNCLSVTPGQASVIYLGEEVILGGIIKEVYKDNEKIWYLS